MSILGNVTLWLALLLGVWGSGAGVLAAKRRDDALLRSAARTPLALLGVLAIALVSLGAGVIRQDFNLAFVATRITRAVPLPYALGAVGTSAPGALLLVACTVAFVTVVTLGRERAPGPSCRLAATASAVIAVIATAALLARPFARLGYTPLEGEGLDPVPRHLLALVELALLDLGLAVLAVAAVQELVRLFDPSLRHARRPASSPPLIIAWVLLSAGLGIRSWRVYAVVTQESAMAWLMVVTAAWVVAGAALYGLPRRGPGQVASLAGLALLVVSALGAALLPTRQLRLAGGSEVEISMPSTSVVLSGLGVSHFEIPGGVTSAATLNARSGAGSSRLLTAERRRYFDLLGHQVGPAAIRPAVLHGLLFDVRVVYAPPSQPAAVVAPRFMVDDAIYQVKAVPLAWCRWLGFGLMAIGGLLSAALRRVASP